MNRINYTLRSVNSSNNYGTILEPISKEWFWKRKDQFKSEQEEKCCFKDFLQNNVLSMFSLFCCAFVV